MAKILIVEDDLDICETYMDILEAAGHSVKSVDRASQAFHCLSGFCPDMVILDMLLPGDSGMLVAAFIRRYPRLAKTKIAIISGHPDLATEAVSIYGADVFLNKPVTPELLRSTIRDLVPARMD
jgi:DNA-binding response OmpR family regulator